MAIGSLVAALGILLAYCSGVIRPPRPMFHDDYGTVGFELVSEWKKTTPIRDEYGQWAWIDAGDNIVAVHATATADSGRSHAMIGGRRSARFRLGSAWDDTRDNQYAEIPRQPDSLFVILPDGRWMAFSLRPKQADQFFRRGLEEGILADVLLATGTLLVNEVKARYEEFLKGYVRPQREKQENP
jgi:hypothetical protein